MTTLTRIYGFNVINAINNQLTNMRENDGVIKELMQNADDAPDVTTLEFVLDAKKLCVRNNGTFSDEDFDHVMQFASGGKRDSEEMTGFFGIGFTSTYLISDNPQIRSAKCQIKFIPEPDLSQISIEHDKDLPELLNTEFTFPWAIGDEYGIRAAFGVPALTQASIQHFFDKLKDIIPKALLFLKKLECVTIRMDNQQHIYTRNQDGNLITITTDGIPCTWQTYNLSFENEPGLSTMKISESIPSRYRPKVSIALPGLPPKNTNDITGKYYCTLPTMQPTSLPFHINANFRVSSDRKSIMELQYSKWNQLICQKAVECFSANLMNIYKCYEKAGDKEYLWVLLNGIHSTHKKDIYWETIKNTIISQWLPIFTTMSGRSLGYSQVVGLRSTDSYKVLGSIVLQDVISESLTKRAPSGVLSEFSTKQAGFGYFIAHILPDILSFLKTKALDTERYNLMVTEIIKLAKKDFISKLEQENLKIAINYNHEWCSSASVWKTGSKEIAEMLHHLGLGNHVLLFSDDNHAIEQIVPSDQTITTLTTMQDFDSMMRFLQKYKKEIDIANRRHLIKFLIFLEENVIQLKEIEFCKELGQLKIWPTRNSYEYAKDVWLTGVEGNPLPMDGQIDDKVRQKMRGLLSKVRIKTQTIEQMLEQYKEWFDEETSEIVESRRSELLEFLQNKVQDFSSDSCRAILASIRFVKCTDERTNVVSYHCAPEVYFTQQTLLKDKPYVDESEVETYRQLYERAGVAEKPRPADIVASMDALSKEPTAPENTERMEDYIVFLAKQTQKEWDVVFKLQAPPVDVVCHHVLDRSKQSQTMSFKVYKYLQRCIEDERCNEEVITLLKDQPCIMIEPSRFIKPSCAFFSLPNEKIGDYFVGVRTDKYSNYIQLLTALGVRQEPIRQNVIETLQAIAADYKQAPSQELVEYARLAWKYIEALADNSTDLRSLSAVTCIPIAKSQLKKPKDVWLMLPTDPHILSECDDRLVTPFVRRELLEQAGCHLAKDIITATTQIVTEGEDSEAEAVIASRIGIIARVLSKIMGETSSASHVEELRKSPVAIIRASSGIIHYHVRFPNEHPLQEIPIDIGEAKSIYLSQPQSIYYYLSPSNDKWDCIAKELITALSIENLALIDTLYRLLSTTPDEFRDYCIRKGYHYEDEDKHNQPQSDALTDSDVERTRPADTDEDEAQDEPTFVSPTPLQENGASHSTNDLGGYQIPYTDTSERDAHSASGRGEAIEGSAYRDIPQAPHNKFIADSGNKRSGQAEYNPGASQEARNQTGNAGVDIVMKFERREGRIPTNYSNIEASYDIESKASDGKVRYIEVKSCSGVWNKNNVALRNSQLVRAFSSPTDYYLYVVEFVYEQEQTIYLMQNPASRLDLVFLGDAFKECTDHERFERSTKETE